MWADVHGEANSHFSQFCERAKKCHLACFRTSVFAFHPRIILVDKGNITLTILS